MPGQLPRTNVADFIGPALVAHQDRSEIASLLNDQEFGVETTHDYTASPDGDPMVMYFVYSDEYRINIAHLKATRLERREPEETP